MQSECVGLKNTKPHNSRFRKFRNVGELAGITTSAHLLNLVLPLLTIFDGAPLVKRLFLKLFGGWDPLIKNDAGNCLGVGTLIKNDAGIFLAAVIL